MANALKTNENYEYAVVDTTGEYYTNAVTPKTLKAAKAYVWFSIREAEDEPSAASVIIVGLQFKCPLDAGWTDYYHEGGTDFVIGERYLLEDRGPNVQWRAIVKDDWYSSGSVVFGFDW